jgi:hypothetical protein
VLASVARIGAITRGVLRCAAASGAHPAARRGWHRSGADHPAGAASQHHRARAAALMERWTAYPAARFHPVGGVISVVVAADRHSGHALKTL